MGKVKLQKKLKCPETEIIQITKQILNTTIIKNKLNHIIKNNKNDKIMIYEKRKFCINIYYI